MNSDLKKRIPTAIAYVLVILACLYGGKWSTTGLLWLFYTLCLYEFITIETGKKSNNNVSPAFLLVANQLLISLTLLELPTMVWLIAAAISSLYFIANAAYLLKKMRVLYKGAPILINAILYLTLPFGLLIYITQHYDVSIILIFSTFLLMWISDAGAYFAGKAFGKNKLYPALSPGKTWEGLVGGEILALIAMYVLSTQFNYFNLKQWLFIGIIIWLFGVLGDLSESGWKRQHGIKDSGTILPGHGGFLDRLDSFIYTAPFVALIIIYLNG